MDGNSTLNEYEKQRQENIRRNEEVLRQLIPDLVGSRYRRKPKPLKKPTKKEPSTPTRKSLRIRGLKPDGPEAKREVEERNKIKEEELKKLVRIEGDVDLNSVRSKATSIDDTNHFIGILSDLTKSMLEFDSTVKTVKNEDIDYSSVAGGKEGLTSIRWACRSLSIGQRWPAVKVSSERIYSLAVHPSKDKILVAAGDKVGSLCFWDVKENVELENGDIEPRTYMFKPHSKSVLVTKYSPIDSNQLFTCSYDGSIRYFDLNSAKFMEAFVSTDEDMLTSMDFNPNGNVIYFSTIDGKFGIKDLREPVKTFEEHFLHDQKIGNISINPIHPNFLVTSSLDRSMRLWDIRNLNPNKPDDQTHIQEFVFSNSVTSAFWSPNGDQIVTTCFDNMVRVFDFNNEMKLKTRVIVPHDNRTGRWVTMFRATWNPNPNLHPHFIIGNMKRSADVISGVNGELIWNLRDENLTAIPAVNAFHPNINFVATGNGSGKLIAWG
ncbi:9380_t:CDS:2 [Diversispora eburnea]|uniref:DNA damage-binding protein CMR1 n=1 Tax=Diversispora eburnea TaxID=1213867 RepID=A0A9N8V485_9GLOM|nr:9380_t:CDS:2 [Diversispora eburnea]